MKQNTAYQKILNRNGFGEFKELIKKWEALSVNMRNTQLRAPIILPDIFLVSHSGTGRTTMMRLLAEYLAEKNDLMSFYGDVEYFEFMLNYCSPGEHFSELQRLMDEIRNAAGFRCEYRGIVYIDIDEWRDHFEEKHFASFMEYLSDNSDDWLVVLSVSDKNKEQIAKMETFVSAYLRIERVNIELPTVYDLMEYGSEILGLYGITLSDEARAVISESVKTLCKNKYFDGYKTVKMFCRDIAYESYTEGVGKDGKLDADDVAKFSKDGDYIRRMLVKIEKKTQTGFC